MEEGSCCGDCRLEVFGKPSVAADPGEEALNHPAGREAGEAGLIGRLSEDLNDDDGRSGHPLMIVSGVSKSPLGEGKEAARAVEQWTAVVAILYDRQL